MFSIGFLTVDLVILIAIFALSFFWSLNKGKKIIFRFIILSYPAVLIFLNFPFYTPDTAMLRLTLYAVVFVLLYIFLGKTIVTEKSYGKGKFLDATLLGLSVVSIILTLHSYILNLENLYSPNLPYVTKYFAQIPTGFLYIIPLVVVAIVRRRGE